MKDNVVYIILILLLAVGSYSFGRHYEKGIAAERVKTAVEREMKVQAQNEIDVHKMGDTARCAALNGKLSKNGECR